MVFERGDPLLGEGGAQEHVDVRAHQDVAEQLKLVIALNSRKTPSSSMLNTSTTYDHRC